MDLNLDTIQSVKKKRIMIGIWD